MSLECFTRNQKTILSIDFARGGTCKQRCPYCYVDNMERIYPFYLDKVKRNNEKAIHNSDAFAKRLNYEYTKARKSKSKINERLEVMPVRLYGSGDFIPAHLEFIKHLNFKAYIISKNLTRPELKIYIEDVKKLPNITRILLSFDNQNIGNYDGVKQYLGKDKIGFCFTGLPDDFRSCKENGYKFDVFFNTGNTRKEKEAAKLHKESCPVDAGSIRLQKACSHCNKCWQSTVTGTSYWNKLQ